MNGIERVAATLGGGPTDRRAVSLTLSLYGAGLTGCPLREYYTDASAYARGQSAVFEAFHPDILFGPFSLPLEGAAFGSEVRFLDAQAPNLIRPALSSIDELDNLAIPDPDTDPGLLYFQEAVGLMSREHGAETAIAAVSLGPEALPAMILGIEGWLETLLFDRDGAARMLEMTIPFVVRHLNGLLSSGASFVVLPAAFANPGMVTREVAEKVTVPALAQALAEIEGSAMIHSAGGTLVPYLDVFTGLPNVVGFVVNPGESFQLAREKVGPDPVLVGNIDGPQLCRRKAGDVRAEIDAVLEERRGDPRFILGSSAADIALDTPAANIEAFRERVDEHGDGG